MRCLNPHLLLPPLRLEILPSPPFPRKRRSYRYRSSPRPSCTFKFSLYINVATLSKRLETQTFSPLKIYFFLQTNRRGYRLIIDFSEFLILWSQIDFQIFFFSFKISVSTSSIKIKSRQVSNLIEVCVEERFLEK